MVYQLEKLRELLRNTQKICIVTHRHADLDAYACGVAVKELITKLGRDAYIVIPEGLSHDVKSFISKLSISYQGLSNCSDGSDMVILVDVSTYAQLNEFRDIIGNKPIVVIDHHEVHNITPTLAIINSSATSCSEIVAQVLKELDIEPSNEVATLLIGGILSDSGRLSRARPETFEVMAWLLRLSGRNYRDIINAMSEEMTFPERMAIVKGLLRMRVYRINDYIVCLSNVNAYESSLADTMIRAGCDIALVASEHDEEIRLFGRGSKRIAEKISLAEVFSDLARYFNGEGGGHVLAAALSTRARVDTATLLIKALSNIEQKFGIKSSRISE
ncbi:DHH family phosphoesterase [Vulcanisaeta moutnovskia]|uniref:DHH family phosphoesterase n=1 Tax=Vulcanisaeta moutnovskia TaxID=985052 RepID=UPI001ED8F3C8|nr:DHH family phosphoesterase [Vulcanisaeta moutnovskia]